MNHDTPVKKCRWIEAIGPLVGKTWLTSWELIRIQIIYNDLKN
jgi:hypothetical protein